ncbi:hypothetical protein WA538_002426, partial [Blastocystis sp. DL]
YIDRVSFYQIQSPEKCLLNHFLYPINKELFFVNEAQVSFPTSVVIATNRYNMMCNGSDIIHYRQTSIQTAVTNNSPLKFTNVLLFPIFPYRSIYHYSELAGQIIRYFTSIPSNPIPKYIWIFQSRDTLERPWVYDFIMTSLFAVNKTHIPLIRTKDYRNITDVTIFDSVVPFISIHYR